MSTSLPSQAFQRIYRVAYSVMAVFLLLVNFWFALGRFYPSLSLYCRLLFFYSHVAFTVVLGCRSIMWMVYQRREINAVARSMSFESTERHKTMMETAMAMDCDGFIGSAAALIAATIYTVYFLLIVVKIWTPVLFTVAKVSMYCK